MPFSLELSLVFVGTCASKRQPLLCSYSFDYLCLLTLANSSKSRCHLYSVLPITMASVGGVTSTIGAFTAPAYVLIEILFFFISSSCELDWDALLGFFLSRDPFHFTFSIIYLVLLNHFALLSFSLLFFAISCCHPVLTLGFLISCLLCTHIHAFDLVWLCMIARESMSKWFDLFICIFSLSLDLFIGIQVIYSKI